jgi:plasmid stabilization system protein ParE
MSEFVFHPEAVKDLDEIWEFIAADSLDAADRTIEEIYEPSSPLSRFLTLAAAAPISPRKPCDSNPCASM